MSFFANNLYEKFGRLADTRASIYMIDLSQIEAML